jgi:hypothetical protein
MSFSSHRRNFPAAKDSCCSNKDDLDQVWVVVTSRLGVSLHFSLTAKDIRTAAEKQSNFVIGEALTARQYEDQGCRIKLLEVELQSSTPLITKPASGYNPTQDSSSSDPLNPSP